MILKLIGALDTTISVMEVPNKGDLVFLDGNYYSVLNRIYNLETDEITLQVELSNNPTNSIPTLIQFKVLDYINQGEKLQAVKYLKEQTNISLKEAKDFVDNLSEKLEKAKAGLYYDKDEGLQVKMPF